MCKYSCKSKPTIENHKKKTHGNTAQVRIGGKKRHLTSFNCGVCQSTFDSKHKLDKHAKEQHNVEEDETPSSPARKAQKPEDLDQRIEEEKVADEIMEDDREETIITKGVDNKEEMEEMKKRVENTNRQNYEIQQKFSQLENERNYYKEQVEKATKYVNDLNFEHQKILKEKDDDINLLKTELEKYNNLEDINVTNSEAITISIKCRECDYRGKSEGDLKEHHRKECSEALINKLLQEEHVQIAEVSVAPKEASHPQSQVDECVTNVRCAGNCKHVTSHQDPNHGEINKVTCYDCKKQFKDKVSMMDHKRDSDHPSKRKCNRLPDCEKGSQCWFVHSGQVRPQTPSRAQSNPTVLTCRDCEQVFSDRNDLMFHKKRAHPSNIMCSNFLNGFVEEVWKEVWKDPK